MITVDTLLPVGYLGRTHGLHGACTVVLDDEDYAAEEGACLFVVVDGCPVPFFVNTWQRQNAHRALVQFDTITTLSAAAALVSCPLYRVPTAEETPLAAPSFVGYSIFDTTTQSLTAPIKAAEHSANNPLYTLADGTLIPVADEWIVAVDTEKRIVSMSLPEGLLAL